MVEPFREAPPRTAARAFPRGLNGELVRGVVPATGEGRADPGLDALCSDAAD